MSKITFVLLASVFVAGFGVSLPQPSLAQCDFGETEVINPGQSVCQGGLVPVINKIMGWVTAGIVALGLIVFVFAGYVYMTAGGSSQRIGLAKTLMGSALLGIILAITAQLILNTISPQFAEQVQEPTLQKP